jgi:hypothetical protein
MQYWRYLILLLPARKRRLAQQRKTPLWRFFEELSCQSLPCYFWRLKGVVTGLAGTNTDRLLEVADEYFSVADLPGVGSFADCFNDLLNNAILDGNFDFRLRQEVDYVFCAPVQFGVPLLTTKSFNFGQRHSADANFG